MRINSTLCVLTLVAALMMLAGGETARASTHSATSGLFTVDTRDALNSHSAVSGLFTVDTRDTSNSHSAVSGLFTVDTRDTSNSHSAVSGLFTVDTRDTSNSHSAVSDLFTVDTRNTLLVTPVAGQGKTYGDAEPVLRYTVAGAIEGETPGFTGSLSRTKGETVGTYEINQGNLTLADNGAFLAANYTLAFTKGVTFAINKATAAITWAAPAPIITGIKLSARQLNAVANTPGTFSYNPSAGTELAVGEHVLKVEFTPDDAINWASADAEVELRVVAGTVMWLTVAPDGGEDAITLAFGETETAALAEDEFDVAAIPEQRASLCSLPMSASGVRQLLHDFRPLPGENGITRWRLVIAESGLLGWDISAANQARELYLQQIIDEQPVGYSIDMRKTSSTAVSSGSVYEIAYAPATEARMTLAQGWNFIGCPVMSTQLAWEELLASLIHSSGDRQVLWYWKNGRYKIWPDTEPLSPEVGYFFYSHNQPSSIDINGIKADAVMLLQPGWNLISPPDDCAMPAEGIVSRAWQLNGGAYQFVAPGGILKAGCSYWIFVNSAEPFMVNFAN